MDPSRPRLRGLTAAALLAAAGWLLSAAVPLGTAHAAVSDSLTLTFTPQDIWPPAPVSDLTAAAGAEGQMLLQWTAPDSNNNALTSQTAASSYSIRVATFSVSSVGGSTTTWWALASDVSALPSPAVSAAPPTPLTPGTTQTLLLSQLWPGATYYAMMISYDAVGLVSDSDVPSRTPNGQARALIYDAVPPAPLGLSVTTTSLSSVSVAWSSVTAFDLRLYRVYVDSTPPYDFTRGFTVEVSSGSTSTSVFDLDGDTYSFRVAAVDRGSPSYEGVALESAFASTVTLFVAGIPRLPQAPYGVSLTTTATSATLGWLPAVRYADGTAFTNASAPTARELNGYAVYRATSPILGTWTELTTVSTATLAYTDAASAPQYYYYVSARNKSGASARSSMRSAASGDIYIVTPDDQSYFYVPAAYAGPLIGVGVDPASAYSIAASSRPQDLGGRIVKSVTFSPFQGGTTADDRFALAGLGLVRLRYALSGSSVTPSALGAAAVSPVPQNMSVYWYNGANWLQLYGQLDAATQSVAIQTKYFGEYQLRTVERTGGFFFNPAGLSNRFVTPNGDGKNDTVVFTFDNPRDSAVSISLYDLRGRLVVSGLPGGPVSNSQQWDGRSGGHVVPGGVYIYQIKAEGQTFTGTIVVVR